MTLAVACLRPKRLLLVVWHGKQAEDLARPGPEGGRIENAYAKTAAPGDLWSRRVTFGRRSAWTVDMPCCEPVAFEIHRGSPDVQIGWVRCSENATEVCNFLLKKVVEW